MTKFAKISQLQAGAVLQFARGFDCIPVGETREVKINPTADDDAAKYGTFTKHHALVVECACGLHLLEAQVDFDGDGDSLIGIYPPGTITLANINDKKNPLPNFHARVRKIGAHVGHPENWVHLRRLVKRPGGRYELGEAAQP